MLSRLYQISSQHIFLQAVIYFIIRADFPKTHHQKGSVSRISRPDYFMRGPSQPLNDSIMMNTSDVKDLITVNQHFILRDVER
jgi:hypothetical protein